MKTYLISFLVLSAGLASAQVREDWQLIHAPHAAAQVVNDHGDLYVAVRGTNGPFLDQGYSVRRFDEKGRGKWTVNPSGSDLDTIHFAAVVHRDEIVLGGLSTVSNRAALLVQRLSSKGKTLWQTRLPVLSPWPDLQLRALEVDGDGNVIVAALAGWFTLFDPESGSEAWLAKIDSKGRLLWSRTVRQTPDAMWTWFNGLAVDAAGNILVGGGSTANITPQEVMGSAAFVARYSPTGQLLWGRDPGFPAFFDFKMLLATDALGALYTAGFRPYQYPEGTTLRLRKLDTNGVALWQASYDGPAVEGSDVPATLAVDGDGNVIVAGSSSIPFSVDCGNARMVALSFAPGGQLRWGARFSQSQVCSGVSALAVDPRGGSYLAGISVVDETPFISDDLIHLVPTTLKLSSDGAREWVVLGDEGTGAIGGLALNHKQDVHLLNPDATVKYEQKRNSKQPQLIGPLSLSETNGALVIAVKAAGKKTVLHYRWFRNGEPVPDAADAPTLANPEPGEYWVEVSNENGTAASPLAWVGIAPPVVVSLLPVP